MHGSFQAALGPSSQRVPALNLPHDLTRPWHTMRLTDTSCYSADYDPTRLPHSTTPGSFRTEHGPMSQRLGLRHATTPLWPMTLLMATCYSTEALASGSLDTIFRPILGNSQAALGQTLRQVPVRVPGLGWVHRWLTTRPIITCYYSGVPGLGHFKATLGGSRGAHGPVLPLAALARPADTTRR